MSRVQGLFDKGYTPRLPQSSLHQGGTTIEGGRVSERRAGAVRAAVLTAGLLLSVLAGSAGPAAATQSPAPTSLQPWNHYDTGRVNVVFPAQLPAVTLVQDANASVSASLQLTGVYELSSGTLSNGTIVAAAFPDQAAAFNGSAAVSGPNSPLSLTAQLAAFPVHATVWQTGALLAPTGSALGATTLTVSYSPTTNTAAVAGVGINWSLSSWPWVGPHDFLALSFAFGYATGAALTACTGSSLLYHTMPPCSGSSVANGTAVWGAGYTSVEGEGGGGPVAVVSWGNSVLFGTATSPITLGALANGTGASDLLLSAPEAGGDSGVSGTIGFALVAPAAPTLVAALLEGNSLIYGGSALVLGAIAVAGVLVYRRNDRRARELL
ncbi:MAG: hypothetical protein L3K17_03710 [Thermoplasmata archaeon]|nr:hypothetical protein [Thermoplasmata archaeon]